MLTNRCLLLAVTLCACSFGEPPDVTEQSTFEMVLTSGDGQTGIIGSPLAAPLVVTVQDSAKNPVPDFTVNFVVTGGVGGLSEASVRTDILGRAQTALTSGPGLNTVEARADLATSPILFSATGLVGIPAQLVIVSGDQQTGTAGSSLTSPLVVRVEDANTNPIPGVAIEFFVTNGTGSISTSSASSDAEGRAEATFTPGPGSNKVEARTALLAPAVFSATGGAGSATQLVKSSGDGQSSTVNTPLAAPFIVTVRDANSIAVSGVGVDFVVTSGNGSASVASATTDALGQARTTLTLGTTAGDNRVEVRIPGAPISPVVFSAIGGASVATQLVLASGSGQSGTVNAALAAPFVVIAKDAFGNGVSNVGVTFVVTGGGGNVSSPAAQTNSTGQAQSVLTLGVVAGPNTIEARAAGLSGSPVTFIATANAGAIAAMVLTSGNNQLGTAMFPLAQPFVVTARDIHQNLVPNGTVTFVVTSGDGSLSTSSAQTDAQGRGQTVLTPQSFLNNTVEVRAPSVTSIVFLSTTRGLNAKVDFDLPAGSRPLQIAAADFDQDGKLDLAIANSAEATISILRNTTTNNANSPTFAPRIEFATGLSGISPTSIVAGDFNGDGKINLAVTNANGTVTMFLNTTSPSINFEATNVVSGGFLGFFVGGDFDGDDRVDLAATQCNPFCDFVLVRRNVTLPGASTTSFTQDSAATFVSRSGTLATADIDGDGKLDLVVGSQGGAVVLRNTTTAGNPITFALISVQASPSEASVAIGDFDGDGRPDLAFGGSNDAFTGTFVQRNTTTNAITFDNPIAFTTEGGPSATADVNGDGKPDLFVVGASIVSVLLNNTTSSTIAFKDHFDFPISSSSDAHGIVVADLNGDGKPDVAVTNMFANSVSVLLAR